MTDPLRTALTIALADALTKDWPGDTRLETAPAIVDYLLNRQDVRVALGMVEPTPELVCALCLFVGDSEDPRPVTVMNGQLTCEPHNGYFQGDAHVQAIIQWKRQNPDRADAV